MDACRAFLPQPSVPTVAGMKKGIQALMQMLLGFDNYLFWFCQFKIATFRWESRKKEGDFRFFLKLLSSTDHVLDIGANIGLMTVQLARQVSHGRVIAIEPIPANFRALQRIIRHFRLANVITRQLALGERPGSLTMSMPVMKGVKMQGLAHVDDKSIEGYGQADQYSFEVPVACLDHLDVIQSMSIQAIKIDVENYEQFVFRGGRNLLTRDHPIIYCELWPNENRKQVFQFLTTIDYQIFVFDGHTLVPFAEGIHDQHNFFFLPPGRSFHS